jgi:rare lipoprotein A (peptidoglycan hydrolase)
MRFHFRTVTVVLTLVAALAVLGGASSAMASAGGASAPAAATSSPTTVKSAAAVHPTGLATWFGPGFYGHKTACGQTLTPAVEGLANRTLPCGTLVRVAYHGHAITLPVLDRGPYSHIGAAWDLTAGAAQALGITETVRIHTSLVGEEPNSPTLGTPTTPASTLVAGGALAG